MNFLTSLLIASCIFLSSCVNDAADTTHRDSLPRKLTASEKKVIGSSGSFSYNIFQRVAASEDNKNVFISPLSISMALGMTMNGASGQTRIAMKQALDMPDMDMDEINKSYQSLIKLLVNLDPKVKMKIANSIWSKEGFKVKKSFLDESREYFNAEVSELDFEDPEAADVINNWVDEHTNGLIEKIIEGRIPPEMVMYLINAIYFKGSWLHEFDPGNTKEHNFTLESGDVSTVDMMNRDADVISYVSDEVKMVDLPYGDSLYTMTVLMPADAKANINDFISRELTQQNMAEWYSNMRVVDRKLGLPKFKMEYEKFLNDILKDMGMGIAFTQDANFKNINDSANLYISEVKHKTFVEVNEEGTEAAAVTSVGVGITSVGPEPPQPIIFDRPFVFIIRERISGTVLFMGVMRNPDQ